MAIWQRIVNAILYLAACALLATGLALELRLESDDRGRTLLGFNGHAWGEVHFILGLVVGGLVALHLVMDWPWIRALLARLRWPAIAVLAGGLLLVAAALTAPVGGNGGASHGQDHHEH